MKRFVGWLGLIFGATMTGGVVWGQAAPTAGEVFVLSVFGGGSGVKTDVLGGRNVGITAGAELAVRSFFGVTPSLEIRAMTPVDSGTIAGEKELMGGVKVSRGWRSLHPYMEFLAGRGAFSFQRGGYNNGTLIYHYASTPAFAAGAGLEVDLTQHWALQGDYEYQFWTVFPPVPGAVNPQVGTGSVVYRFDFNRHRR